MRRNNDVPDGCLGAVFIGSLIIAVGNVSPIAGVIVTAIVGVLTVICLVDGASKKRKEEEARLQRETEIIKQKAQRIAEVKAKSYEILTKDDFIYLGDGLSDIEFKKLCLNILKSGNHYAIGPLLNAFGRIIKGLSPHEVIDECDTIIDLIPNARSFYCKGMALKQLERYDEAIVEIQKAIVIDQSEETPELKLLGHNLRHVKQELAQIKAVARRMHIEKEGAFNLVKTGTEYENFVCGIIRRQGASCKRVGQSGDDGADVLANLKSGTLVIQCKFYSTPVGYDAVQQVYTAKSIYKGTWCCVVTNATFTRQAIEGGNKLGVRLLSHVDLEEYVKSLS